MVKDRERVRLMVSVSAALSQRLEELAKADGRAVAYFAGMMLGLSCYPEGKRSFGQWLAKRLVAIRDSRSKAKMRQVASADKERIQVLLAKELVPDLESIAEAMDCTPVKIAGLLLEHAVDAYSIRVKLLSSRLARPLVILIGRPDQSKPPEEIEEYISDLPWMKPEASGEASEEDTSG